MHTIVESWVGNSRHMHCKVLVRDSRGAARTCEVPFRMAEKGFLTQPEVDAHLTLDWSWVSAVETRLLLRPAIFVGRHLQPEFGDSQ